MSKREMHTELTELIIGHLHNFTTPVGMPEIQFLSFEFLEHRRKEAIKRYQNDPKFHAQVQTLLAGIMFVVDRYTDNHANPADQKSADSGKLKDLDYVGHI